MTSWRSNSSSTIDIGGYGSLLSQGRPQLLLHLREPVVQRIAGAAHGPDRILLAAGIEQFAQAADVHIHRAFVDINVAAPDAVQQLLPAEHAAWMLQEKLQQAILGRTEVDRTSRTGDPAFLAV